MLGFTPFKKHANKFNYIPRYYDPEKEAREQRRAELHGRRSDDDGEYRPGQYIRTQREARTQRRNGTSNGRMRIWIYLGIAFLALLFIQAVYPRLAAFFANDRPTPVQVQDEYGDFDPYAPITVVPNDYEE